MYSEIKKKKTFSTKAILMVRHSYRETCYCETLLLYFFDKDILSSTVNVYGSPIMEQKPSYSQDGKGRWDCVKLFILNKSCCQSLHMHHRRRLSKTYCGPRRWKAYQEVVKICYFFRLDVSSLQEELFSLTFFSWLLRFMRSKILTRLIGLWQSVCCASPFSHACSRTISYVEMSSLFPFWLTLS